MKKIFQSQRDFNIARLAKLKLHTSQILNFKCEGNKKHFDDTGVWYSINCTTKSAWVPILLSLLALVILGLPRFAVGELFMSSDGPDCREADSFLDQT